MGFSIANGENSGTLLSGYVVYNHIEPPRAWYHGLYMIPSDPIYDIANARRMGLTDEQIRRIMMDQGWNMTDIDQAMTYVKEHGEDMTTLKGRKRSRWPAILVVLFLAVAALGAWYAWRNGIISRESLNFIPPNVRRSLGI